MLCRFVGGGADGRVIELPLDADGKPPRRVAVTRGAVRGSDTYTLSSVGAADADGVQATYTHESTTSAP